MTITYRCDRCGGETTPEKLYEVAAHFTPHASDGGEDTDRADRKWLGQLCADCTDVVEPLLQALVQPPTANAVRDDAAICGAIYTLKNREEYVCRLPLGHRDAHHTREGSYFSWPNDQPEPAPAVREDVNQPIVPLRANESSSYR